MPLPTCECVESFTQASKLDAIYCALLEIANAGGGGITEPITTLEFVNEGAIVDEAGAEILVFETVVGAVNHITIYNAATGSNPFIEVDGPDADIGFQITTKGNGGINLSAPLVETSLALNVGSDLGVGNNATIGGNLTAGTALISGNIQFATVGVGADAPAADGTYANPTSITIANGVITAIS